MNPFDLPGPEFLLFYLLFAAIVIGFASHFRRSKEEGRPPKMDLDPYTIAYLRGGINEVVRVAVVSLVDRGLLTANGTSLKRPQNVTVASARQPIERWILEACSHTITSSNLFINATADSVSAPFKAVLDKHSLLPDAAMKQNRRTVFWIALLTLLCVSFIKIQIALSRGRTNVWFLILLTVIACAVLINVCFPRLSRKGQAMLEDLRMLYAGLKKRAASIRAGGAELDALMLAAVFGIAMLPAAGFAFTKTLFPQASGATSTSGCGSSCGSSCGGSCGGGCGGGCGGCGS